MDVTGSAEAQRRQRRNASAGGPAGVRDAAPNKSHFRRFQSFFVARQLFLDSFRMVIGLKQSEKIQNFYDVIMNCSVF